MGGSERGCAAAGAGRAAVFSPRDGWPIWLAVALFSILAVEAVVRGRLINFLLTVTMVLGVPSHPGVGGGLLAAGGAGIGLAGGVFCVFEFEGDGGEVGNSKL